MDFRACLIEEFRLSRNRRSCGKNRANLQGSNTKGIRRKNVSVNTHTVHRSHLFSPYRHNRVQAQEIVRQQRCSSEGSLCFAAVVQLFLSEGVSYKVFGAAGPRVVPDELYNNVDQQNITKRTNLLGITVDGLLPTGALRSAGPNQDPIFSVT